MGGGVLDTAFVCICELCHAEQVPARANGPFNNFRTCILAAGYSTIIYTWDFERNIVSLTTHTYTGNLSATFNFTPRGGVSEANILNDIRTIYHTWLRFVIYETVVHIVQNIQTHTYTQTPRVYKYMMLEYAKGEQTLN